MAILKYPAPEVECTLSELSRIMGQLLDGKSFDDFQSRLQKSQDDGTWQKLQHVFTGAVQGKDNWATESFQKTLLSNRYSIPSSTLISAVLEDDPKHSDQLQRAAKMLYATACIKTTPELITKIIGMEQGELLKPPRPRTFCRHAEFPDLRRTLYLLSQSRDTLSCYIKGLLIRSMSSKQMGSHYRQRRSTNNYEQ
ncbi:uncharacterized protein [Amphiura filiformis]|uniref:uncharacterized protein n=1 Tax=Amphiura filiformis TaxID=82378 RepID=UPI003B21D535